MIETSSKKYRNKKLNIGCLNVRGCKNIQQRETIVQDCLSNKIDILGITETHVEESGLEFFETDKQQYAFYLCGQKGKRYQGVGIAVRKELNPVFKEINERFCKCEVKLDNRKLIVIVAYAPTLQKSEKNTEVRDDFYEQLDAEINKVANRHCLVVVGDFNAKTGSGWKDFPEVMGKFGKGLVNSNGLALLECMKSNSLVLTNTLFRHKLSHVTTWEAPEKTYVNKEANKMLLGPDGKPRRNPFRNQIDYIAVRTEHTKFVTNSRSTSNIHTETDHRMVKMEVNFEWYKLKNEKKDVVKKPDLSNFSNKVKQFEYQKKMEEINFENANNPQEKWNKIAHEANEISLEVMGTKSNKKLAKDPEIELLSIENQKLRLKIDSSKNPQQRHEAKCMRKIVKNKIQKKIAENEKAKIDNQLTQMENVKNDSNKYFQAVREIKRKEKKSELVVENDEGNIVGSHDKQATAIAQHFERMLAPNDKIPESAEYIPSKMSTPFNAEEIEKAAKSMKNGKSCGIDNIHAEHIKYAPSSIHNEIAEILNETAETGKYPKELKIGILTLPKPNKKKGPRENLRPIMLLSVLRKILTICMIHRAWERISTRISKDQAAYQNKRSTTEQVLAVKLLVEKAITSSDFTIYILMLDMSKAFDTVDRKQLFEALEEVLLPEEIHLLHILINDVYIKVRVGDEYSNAFKSLIGIIQGDCLSAILFIFYLAQALTPRSKRDHNYAIENFNQIKWKSYIKEENLFTISPKYADDITWASNDEKVIEMVKKTVPPMLKEAKLKVNDSKTETYAAPQPARKNILKEHSYSKHPEENEWKKCKLLGSFIDTERDIKHRKSLVISSMRNNREIYKSKHLSIDTKIRYFKCFETSIFLYNSALWTITPTLAKSIDSFHRRLLRKVIGFQYPKKISNQNIYKLTKERQWNKIIEVRRMKLIGHICRLGEDTPARQALREVLKNQRNKIGRPKLTWIRQIRNDLENRGVIANDDFGNVIELAQERDYWRNHFGSWHEKSDSLDAGCASNGADL